MNPAPPPDLSVVIIGRNEGQRLVKCIESVKSLAGRDYPTEVIYVDSDSQDDSPARAAQLGAIVITVRPERPCAAIGRNAGWRAAKAPQVMFLDGDTVLQPGFIEKAREAMRDPAVAVVWGHRREAHPEQSIFNRVLDLDWIYPPGPTDFCGGDAMMRRSVLEEVGGFGEHLIAGEEPELCQRMRAKGYVILHIDQPMTRHDLAITRWAAYWRRAVRAGYAYADVSQRLKNTAFPLWRSEAKRNWIHSAVLATLLLGAAVATATAATAWPLVFAGLTYLALSLRSAYRARWKCDDPWTLLCYGIHSHLQQIPITVGQIEYWWNRLQGRKRHLIEYK